MSFPTNFRKVVFPVTTVLLGLGLFLAVTEVGIRVVVPSERWRYRDSTYDFRIDPVLGWVRGPNLDSGRFDYMTNELIRTRTNSDGLMPHARGKTVSSGSCSWATPRSSDRASTRSSESTGNYNVS